MKRRFASLLLLALAAPLFAQSCGGVLSNSCNTTRPINLATGAAALPAQFETCVPANAFLQGLTVFDIPAGYSLRISITGLTADLDLFVHQPPGVCESDLQTSAYRVADSGGLGGTAPEEELLTPGELAAYGCGWLGIAVYSKAPGGGSCSLSVVCESPLSCTLTGPAGTAGGAIALQLMSTSASASAIDITFEYSLDGGATWALCAAAGSSPLPNPAIGVAPGAAVFSWDSFGDMVGRVALAPGVLVRASVSDGASTSSCTTAPFDIDNTSLCPTFCGDCNLNSAGPDILDALTAAQLAAGAIPPQPGQDLCCDVNASGGIEILDALILAQAGAGLAVTLLCP